LLHCRRQKVLKRRRQESDGDESDDSDDGADDDLRNREDLNSLLVKAWETNVFPAIRQQFKTILQLCSKSTAGLNQFVN
jgi:hypothetical protein